MNDIEIEVIVATAVGGVIANSKINKMLWYLPRDFKHFKETTIGGVLIMGRKTYESIGKPLPGREHIIITRDPDYVPENGNEYCHVCTSLNQALSFAKEIAGERKIFIAGGGEIYSQVLTNPLFRELVKKVIISDIEAAFTGDIFFPTLDPLEWRQVCIETFEPDEKNLYRFSIRTYVPMSVYI